MRAVWIATVDNMDWPSRPGLSTERQKAEMIAILDRLVQLHMNAVIFQVRPAADAFYESSLEPWSEYLTGTMGKAPSPFYDPLAFTVAEAHKRGLELHVWINPYRARNSTKRPSSSSHVTRAHPAWVHKYGPYVWMDPGIPAVREHTIRVVVDMVKRYDIDAVHMDDYFYPYPELRRRREIPFPDDATYKRYKKAGGTLSRGDWRRQNVNLLVHELYDAVHATKPWVRFGVSPFGIWRPGYPASVRGLDQYTELFADARKWWNEGWVDYLVPQLYWPVSRPQQSYVELLKWWSDQNFKHRNLWAGNYTGKVAFTNSSHFDPSEITEQVKLTRVQPGSNGNVHFSMNVFMRDPQNLNATLLHDVYSEQALVPASPWLENVQHAAPVLSMRVDVRSPERFVEMHAGKAAPWLWFVRTYADGAWSHRVVPGHENIVSLPAHTVDVRVMSVDRVGNLSPESRVSLPRN